jgi:hypothetical protein
MLFGVSLYMRLDQLVLFVERYPIELSSIYTRWKLYDLFAYSR